MATQINITVGDQRLLQNVKNRAAANQQALDDRQQNAKIEDTATDAVEREEEDRNGVPEPKVVRRSAASPRRGFKASILYGVDFEYQLYSPFITLVRPHPLDQDPFNQDLFFNYDTRFQPLFAYGTLQTPRSFEFLNPSAIFENDIFTELQARIDPAYPLPSPLTRDRVLNSSFLVNPTIVVSATKDAVFVSCLRIKITGVSSLFDFNSSYRLTLSSIRLSTRATGTYYRYDIKSKTVSQVSIDVSFGTTSPNFPPGALTQDALYKFGLNMYADDPVQIDWAAYIQSAVSEFGKYQASSTYFGFEALYQDRVPAAFSYDPKTGNALLLSGETLYSTTFATNTPIDIVYDAVPNPNGGSYPRFTYAASDLIDAGWSVLRQNIGFPAIGGSTPLYTNRAFKVAVPIFEPT